MAVRVEPIGRQEIEYRLMAFEERFRMPSSKFQEAFKNGKLKETREFREWAMLIAAFHLATSRQR